MKAWKRQILVLFWFLEFSASENQAIQFNYVLKFVGKFGSFNLVAWIYFELISKPYTHFRIFDSIYWIKPIVISNSLSSTNIFLQTFIFWILILLIFRNSFGRFKSGSNSFTIKFDLWIYMKYIETTRRNSLKNSLNWTNEIFGLPVKRGVWTWLAHQS